MLAYLAIISFATSCVYLCAQLFTSLYQVPGSFLSRFTNLWYARQIVRGDFHLTSVNLHHQHGKILRVAPQYFSIDDPSAHKIIYGHGSCFPKSSWYDGWTFDPDPHKTNLFSERDPKRHAAMRRKVASIYAMTSLVAYEGFVDNCIEILSQRFEEFGNSNSVTDLGHWLQCYAFDVIGEVTFGKRFGFLDAGKDIGNTMAFLDSSIIFCNILGLFIWLRPLLMKATALFGNSAQVALQLVFDEMTEKAKLSLGEEEQKPDAPVTMVRKLLNLQATATGAQSLSDWEVGLASTANVAAGSDTTSIGLSAILFYLYTSPQALQKVREELQSNAIPSRPTFKEMQALPYFQAAIKESMRLHPGVALPLWREVPKGGAVIAGQFFPEKSVVGVNPWVVHRNSTVFGADVDQYRPERWLEAGEDELKLMDQNLIPFGLGSRTCIGKNVSLLEINKLVPVLVREYDIEVLQASGNSEGLKAINYWFSKPVGFHASINRRSKESATPQDLL